MKRLIINADDLGLSPGVNRAILDCAEAGAVRSATALAMGPAFREGLDLLKAREDFGVGIHLNLTGRWGAPTGRVPQGFFAGGPGFLLVSCLAGRTDLDFVEACFRRQFETFLDSGATPTHYDGHHHVHVFPGIAAVAARVATEYGVTKARLSDEETSARWMGPGPGIKRRLLSALAHSARRHMTSAGIRTPDAFFGFGLMGKKDYERRLHALLPRLKGGFSEIMVHPGPENADFEFDPYTQRHGETKALTGKGLLELMEEEGIRPASYEALR